MTGETAGEETPVPNEQEQLREEIDETRQQLGDTVEAIAAKADVKAQIENKVDETKDHARARVEDAQTTLREAPARAKQQPKPVAAIAAGCAVLVALVVAIRRRRA
jgi:Protein of unknown function (DUF3618)